MNTTQATTIIETSMTSEYNNKKFMFAYYDEFEERFTCIDRAFVLSVNEDTVVGQFITTNWFKWAFSTNKSARFMIVCVDTNVTSHQIENCISNSDYSRFHNYKVFTLGESGMKTLYYDIKNESESHPNSSKTFTFDRNENYMIADNNVNTMNTDPQTNIFESFTLNARLFRNMRSYSQIEVAEDDYEQDTLLLSLPSFSFSRNRF